MSDPGQMPLPIHGRDMRRPIVPPRLAGAAFLSS
jgi:hypothetical protein